MDATRFHYATITKPDSVEIGSVMATRYTADRHFQGVVWHASRQSWIFAPAIAGGYLGDAEYTDLVTPVSRATAERVTREALRTDLPSEARLEEMCAEGERLGWTFGPPQEED